MNNVIRLFKKQIENPCEQNGVVPRDTSFEVYSIRLDYIKLTQSPESYKSYREFLMTLNRFIWVIGTEQQNALLRRAQMSHNMKTVLTVMPFDDDDAIEQHHPDMPSWF